MHNNDLFFAFLTLRWKVWAGYWRLCIGALQEQRHLRGHSRWLLVPVSELAPSRPVASLWCAHLPAYRPLCQRRHLLRQRVVPLPAQLHWVKVSSCSRDGENCKLRLFNVEVLVLNWPWWPMVVVLFFFLFFLILFFKWCFIYPVQKI